MLVKAGSQRSIGSRTNTQKLGKEETSKLGGSIGTRHRRLGKGRVTGNRLQGNRWVGRVENNRQGWAGEKGERSDKALYPRKSQAVTPTPQWEEGERASSEGALYRGNRCVLLRALGEKPRLGVRKAGRVRRRRREIDWNEKCTRKTL